MSDRSDNPMGGFEGMYDDQPSSRTAPSSGEQPAPPTDHCTAEEPCGDLNDCKRCLAALPGFGEQPVAPTPPVTDLTYQGAMDLKDEIERLPTQTGLTSPFVLVRRIDVIGAIVRVAERCRNRAAPSSDGTLCSGCSHPTSEHGNLGCMRSDDDEAFCGCPIRGPKVSVPLAPGESDYEPAPDGKRLSREEEARHAHFVEAALGEVDAKMAWNTIALASIGLERAWRLATEIRRLRSTLAAVEGERNAAERELAISQNDTVAARKAIAALTDRATAWLNNIREAFGPQHSFTSPTGEAIIGAAINAINYTVPTLRKEVAALTERLEAAQRDASEAVAREIQLHRKLDDANERLAALESWARDVEGLPVFKPNAFAADVREYLSRASVLANRPPLTPEKPE